MYICDRVVLQGCSKKLVIHVKVMTGTWILDLSFLCQLATAALLPSLGPFIGPIDQGSEFCVLCKKIKV